MNEKEDRFSTIPITLLPKDSALSVFLNVGHFFPRSFVRWSEVRCRNQRHVRRQAPTALLSPLASAPPPQRMAAVVTVAAPVVATTADAVTLHSRCRCGRRAAAVPNADVAAGWVEALPCMAVCCVATGSRATSFSTPKPSPELIGLRGVRFLMNVSHFSLIPY